MSSPSIRLRQLRVCRKLSVAEVADRLEVAASTYREWEAGRKIIGEPYQRLAKIFNVSLSELLTGEGRVEILKRLEQIESHIREIKKTL